MHAQQNPALDKGRLKKIYRSPKSLTGWLRFTCHALFTQQDPAVNYGQRPDFEPLDYATDTYSQTQSGIQSVVQMSHYSHLATPGSYEATKQKT